MFKEKVNEVTATEFDYVVIKTAGVRQYISETGFVDEVCYSESTKQDTETQIEFGVVTQRFYYFGLPIEKDSYIQAKDMNINRLVYPGNNQYPGRLLYPQE